MSGTAASALSCLAPDPARSFNEAATATETYVVVYGRFSFDPSRIPKSEGNSQFAPNDMTEVLSRFVGNGLTPGGFTVPVVRDVTLRFECLGPWCGGASPDVPVLAFVEQTAAGPAVTIGPCGGQMFDRPDEATRVLMKQCMGDGICPSVRRY